MVLFESTLFLLAVAVLLMQLARPLRVPYPSLLALMGGCVAAVPWIPHVGIEPRLALALFVAPAVMDVAFEMPPREMLRMWVPLTSLAIVLVLVTAFAVAWVGVHVGELPIAAALALGAIVAPPDAAAASAVLRQFNLPRRMMAVLQGESLLNDASSLLVFGAAVAAVEAGASSWHNWLPHVALAIPGGAALGVGLGLVLIRLHRHWAGTQSAIVISFLTTYGTWILADRLGLSSIVAVVALAAVVARVLPARTSARDRVNSNAVWVTVVFVLNVLAFLVMGLQAHDILLALPAPELRHELRFAGIVLGTVIGVRFLWVMSFSSLLDVVGKIRAKGDLPLTIPPVRVRLLVAWCGMRGLVTLATAFALPSDFPGRDKIVLSAFTVVLGTLVIQGFTIRPLIKLLRIKPDNSLDEELVLARQAMLDAGLHSLRGERSEAAAAVRAELTAHRALTAESTHKQSEHDAMRLQALVAERALLAEWRCRGRLDDDVYHLLEDELDRAELNATDTVTWIGD